MEIFPSIIHRLKEIRENSLHYSSDLLNRDKDNDGVIDRYDTDERDSKVQEIGDLPIICSDEIFDDSKIVNWYDEVKSLELRMKEFIEACGY